MMDRRAELAYSVEEAARALGIGRQAAYEAARRGELPIIRIGRRILVPKAALERMLEAAAPKSKKGGVA